MAEIIYVIDVRDVVCPKCFREIPVEDVDNAKYVPLTGVLSRAFLKCRHCGADLELRSIE